MPVYSYYCTSCGPKEIRQFMTESTLTACPECGSIEFRKTFNSIGISFRGPGFYSTDSKEAK